MPGGGEKCDAACQKLLLNGRFMAPIADLLAETVGHGHAIYAPAKRLAAACRAHTESWAAAAREGLVEREGKFEFTGCDEATLLMTWVNGYAGPTPPESASVLEVIEVWTRRANRKTLALVSAAADGD